VLYTEASAEAVLEWLEESSEELTARATARGIDRPGPTAREVAAGRDGP
jgi:hypothetical protein